jgi:hypothetical protein
MSVCRVELRVLRLSMSFLYTPLRLWSELGSYMHGVLYTAAHAEQAGVVPSHCVST